MVEHQFKVWLEIIVCLIRISKIVNSSVIELVTGNIAVEVSTFNSEICQMILYPDFFPKIFPALRKYDQ